MKPYRNVFWPSTAAFVLVSGVAGLGWLYGVDMMALKFAQLPASGVLDVLSEAISLAGGIFLTTGLAVTLVATLYLYGRRTLAARIAAAFIIVSLIEVALKLYLPVPPLPLGYVRSSSEELIIRLPNPYPSGHMIRSVFLAGALALLWPGRAVWIAAGVFLLAMAATRVYLGIHWTSDVVGGVLLGVAALAWAFGHDKGSRSKEQARCM